MRIIRSLMLAVALMGSANTINACKPPPWYRPSIDTPFLKAIAGNHVDDVERLLRTGANPNPAVQYDGTTPIRVAVYTRSLAALRALHKAGADIGADRRLTQIVFESPAGADEKAELISTLATMGLNVNLADSPHWSTLSRAVHTQPLDVIRALVNAGADPDLGEPICAAARQGKVDIFKFLLGSGAKLVAACYGSGNLSKLAASSTEIGSVQILQTLVENRYPVDAQALLFDAQLVEQAQFLVSLGADPRRKLADGSTVLHNAPSVDLIRYFVSFGIDVNARDAKGNTPLHKIAERALAVRMDCGAGPNPLAWIVLPIKELLKHGGNPGLYNASRKTPIDLGVDKHHGVGTQLRELLQ